MQFKIKGVDSEVSIKVRETGDILFLARVLKYLGGYEKGREWIISRCDEDESYEAFHVGKPEPVLVLSFPDDYTGPPIRFQRCFSSTASCCNKSFDPAHSDCEECCQKCFENNTEGDCTCGSCRERCHCSGGCDCCLGPFESGTPGYATLCGGTKNENSR